MHRLRYFTLTTVLCLGVLLSAQDSERIIAAEYFIGTDPGETFGVPLVPIDGSFDEVVEELYGQVAINLPLGPNLIGLRLQEETGNWGPVFSIIVDSREPLVQVRETKLIQAEYFWDIDPGEGSGNAFLAVDGALDDALEAISASTSQFPQTDGRHTLGIRLKSADGGWGPIFTTILDVLEPLPQLREMKLTMAEYFWDADPGEGNGTALLAFDGDFDQAIESITQSTANFPQAIDQHRLSLRVKSVDGSWGPIFSTVLEVREEIVSLRESNITEVEYYWDTDPGEGSATTMLAVDGAFDEAIERIMASEDISALSLGVHVLGMRMKDAEDVWGPEFRTVISIEDSITTVREAFVKSAEYYFDTDPGEGSATPILTADGGFDEAIEAIVGGDIPSPVDIGVHTLYVRAMDENDNWGPPFGLVVYMDTTIVPPLYETILNGPTTICDQDLGSAHEFSVDAQQDATVNWTVSNGLLISGQGADTAFVSFSGYGVYEVTAEQCHIDGFCDTKSIQITVPEPSRSDINGDGIVDVNDFLSLNSVFGDACGVCPEDINEDGVVDVNDFLELNTFFGSSCP